MENSIILGKKQSERICLLLGILLFFFTTGYLLDVNMANAQEQQYVERGVPCGAGEQLPASAICIHGAVFSDTNTAIEGAVVTITSGIDTVTGTTFIHPGQITPTYGIDISSLSPAPRFLEPFTIMAQFNGQATTYSFVLFPDLNTFNQEVNLSFASEGALAEGFITGHVFDYADKGSVVGAIITATVNDVIYTTTTILEPSVDPLPAYSFELSGVSEGQEVILTASYGEDATEEIITISPEGNQVDFVTGWRCDDSNPLPEQGGVFGLPEQGGVFGLPNIACIWGIGSFDGESQEGMHVVVQIGEEQYTGETKLFPGEKTPRYGIAIPNTTIFSGTQEVEVIGNYGGGIASVVRSIELEAGETYRVDLDTTGAYAMETYVDSRAIVDMVYRESEDELWAITEKGGVIVYDVESGLPIKQFTTINGLENNKGRDLVISDEGDIYAITQHQQSRYPSTHSLCHYVGEPQNWDCSVPIGRTQTGGPQAHWNISDLYIDDNDHFWVLTPTPFLFEPNNPSNNYLFSDLDEISTAYSMLQASDGTYWFGRNRNIIHYSPEDIPRWETFTSTDFGFSIGDPINTMIQDSRGVLWFGATRYGLISYERGFENEWQRFRTSDGLVNDTVQTIFQASNDVLWIGTQSGISRYNPNSETDVWSSFITDTIEDLV